VTCPTCGGPVSTPMRSARTGRHLVTCKDAERCGATLAVDGLASHIQCVAWSAQQIRGSLAVMAQALPRPTLGALVTRGVGPAVSRSGNTP